MASRKRRIVGAARPTRQAPRVAGTAACVDENSIVAVLEGRQGALETLEKHIDSCAVCRKTLSEIARMVYGGCR
jgi:hypothetical protein